MVSIHTNLSSLIAQGSLTKSTNTLNRAIEQMSTGYKINHASDNAANYSIKTNMDTKIGAYQVAEENAMMGLDMLQTAESSLNQISDKLSRLRALAVTAQNGTYGNQSIQAINAEANALVDEIERIYNNTTYNGIDLMRGQVTGSEESKFIKDIDRRDTSKMTTLASVDITKSLTSGTYSISTADELAKLATMTNNGLIGADTEFVLGADIDLSGYSNWTPIGEYVKDANNKLIEELTFNATFNGNGYEITSFTINSTTDYQGLFGVINYSAKIENLGIEGNLNTGAYSGLLSGMLRTGATIINCYASGQISGTKFIGGFVGNAYRATVLDSYSDAEIEATDTYGCVGGILGYAGITNILGCYFVGKITGNTRVGGILGEGGCTINSCYTEAIINSNTICGGIVGLNTGIGSIENCYSNSELTGSKVGGIAGSAYSGTLNIIDCLVLKENVMSGIFVGGYTIAKNPLIEIENCKYNSVISATNYVAGKENALYVDSNITTCDNTKPFEIKNEALIMLRDRDFCLHVGANNKESSRLDVEVGYNIGSLYLLRTIGGDTGNQLSSLDRLLSHVSAKQTELGAKQNRLMSVLEEINVQYENLVSSRSTIQDADMSEVSATYIQQQILQQASATLMATANQTPAIALQLI